MAYITSEQVKAVREAIKKEFPNYKWSITGKDYSSIYIRLMEADFSEEEVSNYDNTFMYFDKFPERLKEVFSKVKEILFSIVPYHNNSDIMTDYFDYAYYYWFSIGKWDKPYIQK